MSEDKDYLLFMFARDSAPSGGAHEFAFRGTWQDCKNFAYSGHYLAHREAHIAHLVGNSLNIVSWGKTLKTQGTGYLPFYWQNEKPNPWSWYDQ